MGAGAGAAAAVDDDELPLRGAAIEKAQAESREGGGGGSSNSVTVGNAAGGDEEAGDGGGAAEEKPCEKSLRLENEAESPKLISGESEAEVKVKVYLTRRSSELIREAESECVGGDRAGSESQMHVKRNRGRSQRLGNGHTTPKEVESLVDADSPGMELESRAASIASEKGAMLDLSYELLPRQSSHALPRKWGGLGSGQEFEAGSELVGKCGAVSEMAATDGSSRDATPARGPVQSADVLVDSNVDTEEKERESQPAGDAEVANSSTPDVGEVGEAGEADGAASGKVLGDAGTVESGPGDSATIKTEGDADCDNGAGVVGSEKKERVGSVCVETGSDMQRVGSCGDGVCTSVEGGNDVHADTSTGTGTGTDVGGGPVVHRGSGVVRKSGLGRGGSHGRLGSRDRSAQEDKRGGSHHARIKMEAGVGVNRARPCDADAEPGGEQALGAPSCQEELRAEGQAGAVVGGIPRAMSRPSSVSASSNCKHPEACKKEQGPSSVAEADRHKAVLQARANKAREVNVLEEAVKLEGKRRSTEKWHFAKKSTESERRRTHWDYVLEEMSWLAKDFFQERKWKIENAARICHDVAYERNKEEYLALDLVKKQRKRASFLAFAVNRFWRMAEASLTVGNPGGLCCAKAGESRTDTNEAVPMDIDGPASKVAVNKSAQFAKVEDVSLGVKRYALNYMKMIECWRVAEALAPVPPDQYYECNGIPYFFDQELFSKEALYYTVPVGAMEAYRVAVEMERMRAEMEYEEKRAAAVAEAEALAAAEASGDASLGTDFGFSDFLTDGLSQEYESQADFMGEGGHARISKKKRKKIFKNSNSGRRLEGIGLRGFTYQSSDMSTPEIGLESPAVSGKRSLPGELGSNSVPGSIPVKRARSSATNLRPRANHSGISPGGVYPRTGLGSLDQQDDEGLGMAVGLNILDSTDDAPSIKPHGVSGIGRNIYAANKLKSNKKPKSFPGLSNSRSFEGGSPAYPAGKNGDGDSQDHLRYEQEQMKRKEEPNWQLPVTSSDASLGTPTDTPGTPGSQGLSGQQNVKKPKSLRQNEMNSEAATPGSVFSGHGTQQLASAPTANKLLKQSSMRDRNRRLRPNKVPTNAPAGVGIPWSASEDQAILALVNDLGPNWDLVSDVLSSSSQIKGIFRKPKQCQERHISLTERSSTDGTEIQEVPNSLQSQGLKGNMKGPRVHGVPEEDSLKHLECIVQLMAKYRSRKNSSEGQDQKTLAAQHPSHGIVISQYCSGGPPNPLELCDRVTNNGDATPQTFPIQPAQVNVLGPPLGPALGPALRPPSGGLPASPGTAGFNLGQSGVSSSAALSAAAARDAQRFTTKLSPEEATRLRLAAGSLSAYNARRMQQQAVTPGLPILNGLSNPSDLPMLPTSSAGAMLGALNRGLSLPRADLLSMGSPVVSNMVSPGVNGMVPPGGNFSASNMSRRTANLLNVLRGGQCTEEQRVQILQQLQLLTQQGDNQAAAALSSFGSDMAALASSPPQHQPLQQHHFQQQQHGAQLQQQQQVQNQQRNPQQQQQHMQMQANPTQAYYAAARMKEHQQRQLQQQQTLLHHQQKQRLMGTLPPTSQSQHMLAPPHVPSLPPQRLGSPSRILSQQPQHNGLQKQGGPQQGNGVSLQTSQQSLGPSAPASPAVSGQSNPPQTQGPEQVGQSTGSSKPPPGKQTQTPQSMQQRSPRNLAGSSQGPSQAGHPSPLGNSLSSGNGPAPSQTSGQVQAGQKVQKQSGQVQAKNASLGLSQSSGNLGHGDASQVIPSGIAQSKGPQGSQSQRHQQMPQGGVPKHQQGASISTGGQTAAAQLSSTATISQQSQQPVTVPPGQQAQQILRSQVPQPQQLQQPQRSATPLQMPIPGLPGKTGMAQTGQVVASQMMPLANHNPYKLGGAPIGTPINLTNLNSYPHPHAHGVPALNSTPMGSHSNAQWKPIQGTTPLSSGIYNMTRANNTVSGTMTTSGLQVPSFNGTAGPLVSMPQGIGGTVQTQKHGLSPGVNGRGPSGAPQGIPGGQRSQPNGLVMVPSGPTGSAQMRPPGLSSASGYVQGAGSGVPYARVPVPEQGLSVPAQDVSPSAAPTPQRPAVAAVAAVSAVSTASSAGGGTTTSGSSTVPSTGPGPGLPPQGDAKTAPASSS